MRRGLANNIREGMRDRWRGILSLTPVRAGRIILAGFAGLLAAPALAQTVNCAAIQQQISALSRQPSPQAATYQQAARKQQSELIKTQGYANTLGCNRQRFLFFGDPPPPQCNAINQRIAAMQANLGNLQAAVSNSGNEQRRRSLTAQFDAYCRQQVAARPRNFFEQLFGDGPRSDVPIEPLTPQSPPDGDRETEPEETGPRRGSNAVCVRKCDGGFFPVSYSASNRNLDELEELCTALCPNTETILFTKRQNAEIDEAVSSEGQSYESMANAGKFKTKFDPSCTCKPPNRSWADVLASAEKLIANKNRRDLIVTPQKAEELSRPKISPAALRAQMATQRKSASETDEDRTVAALARAGQIEAEAANSANAGITPGRITAGQRFGVEDGKREEIEGPDGAKRTVRIIGPKS